MLGINDAAHGTFIFVGDTTAWPSSSSSSSSCYFFHFFFPSFFCFCGNYVSFGRIVFFSLLPSSTSIYLHCEYSMFLFSSIGADAHIIAFYVFFHFFFFLLFEFAMRIPNETNILFIYAILNSYIRLTHRR